MLTPEPSPEREQVEALAEKVLDCPNALYARTCDNDTLTHSEARVATKKLLVLAAAAVERERELKQELDKVYEVLIKTRHTVAAACRRERELTWALEAAEAQVSAWETWFRTEPWKGSPDGSSHGCGDYSENERKIGYGTYRDPRFLPVAREALAGGVSAAGRPTEQDLGGNAVARAEATSTFGVLSVETGNFLDWTHSREEAEACAAGLRALNPDMPVEAVAVVEFDAGMPVLTTETAEQSNQDPDVVPEVLPEETQ